jgi:hypothetical protein
VERLETRSVPTTFAVTGTVFNDATRSLVGGLWQNTVQESNQGLGTVNHYVSDLTTVRTDLRADVAAHQFSGATLTHVNSILSDLGTALDAAPASVHGGGRFGSVAAAETALRHSHLDILDIVHNDATLAHRATQGGVTGFQQVPQELHGVTAANAPHANLAQIGAIFNDAANRILGGVNSSDIDAINDDIQATRTHLQTLMAHYPELSSGLTGIHADTIVRQLELQLTFNRQAGGNRDAGRANNDNILDIIDIVQGDPILVHQATQGGIVGFAPFPAALHPTTRYQDNQAQTTFWATFIAQSNSLGQSAVNLITHHPHDTTAINTLIGQIQAFQNYVGNFDSSQGGIFGARFDNELLKHNSTLGAEVAGMLRGLRNGDRALVQAAAAEMHANAADVGGNNIPVSGGTYNANGTTIAQVLSTAHP